MMSKAKRTNLVVEEKTRKIVSSLIVTIMGLVLGILMYNAQDDFQTFFKYEKSILVTENCDSYKMKVDAGATENKPEVQLTLTSENLCEKGKKELGFKQKTDWFPVDASHKSLCIYGGFNYSVWEFVDQDGKKTIIDHSKQEFNKIDARTLDSKSMDVVEIPKNAVRARVTYFHTENIFGIYVKGIARGVMYKNSENKTEQWDVLKKIYANLKEEEVYITYGSIPKQTDRHKSQTTELSSKKEIEQKMHEGVTVTITSNEDIDADIVYGEKKQVKEDGEYGVKWNREGTAMVCERIGDSKNLHTNLLKGESWADPYDNDFDEVYPWSEIRECYFDEQGKVHYDIGETVEKSKDIMVEIPKFYIKREVIDDEEQIYISKSYHEGYTVHPAFKKDDKVVDHIYIGKYLSSISEQSIGSYPKQVPLIDLSINEINGYLSKKGDSWKELDLVTLNMLQSLWLVETGIKNTQSVFQGYTEAAFIWSSDRDPKIAEETAKNTNEIVIKKTDYTSKFQVGDHVIVVTYDYEDKYSPYLYFTDYYENDSTDWDREIVDIQEDGKSLKIRFSGEPLDIKKGSSIIANLPVVNGRTDDIPYHTGTESGVQGKTSFKYRNIENLWGNVCTILEGAYVKDDNIVIEYPDGKKADLLCKLPKQERGGTVAEGYECAIHSMCYDSKNPAVFFPDAVGDGATLTNSFGDWYCRPKSDFYMEGDMDKQYITYGMTWDLSAYAGFFAYRIQPTADMKRVENGSRIIYR